MGERYTAKQMIAAVPGSGGLQTEIALRVGCDRRTVARFAKNYPTVAEAIEQEQASIIDMAQGKLAMAVKSGQPWAIKFMLATIGKRRGFTERTEVQTTGKVTVEVEYVNDWRNAQS